MAPIVVDPEVLAGAGVSVSSVGDEIAAAVNTLVAALPNGAMAGHDRAGLAFGQAYQQSAQALMDASGAAVGGGRKVGFGVQLSATNYSRADASSTIGGGGVPLTPPSPPGEFDGPSAPSPFGGGVAEPFLWSMVEMFVGDVWPNGDPAQLRAAGTAWSAFGRSMAGIAGQLEGPSATISGQQIPEGGAMAQALSDLKQGLADICTESAKLGVQLFEFATDVESAQNAIRDLLSRLSPSGIFDAIGAVFSGDAMEELREIADDIRAVIDNLGRQADARQYALQDVTNLLDGAIVSLQQKARKEFVDFLGEDVGNAVATYFDINTNVLEAPLKVGLESIGGLQQLDPLRFAYDFEGAKETWGALGETAFYTNPVGVLTDPIGAFEHGKTMAEGFVHADEWSTDRPGLGPAMAATEIASMVIPGAGVTKATKAADIAGDIAEAGPAVRAAGAVDNAVTDTASIGGRAEGIAEKLDDIGDNLTPNASPDAPGPAIPRDLAEPPRVGEAPPTPTPLAPDAPPAHVPDSTPTDRTPVAPHNSAPTETPRAPIDAGPRSDAPPISAGPESHTSAADMPAGSQHSATAPAGSGPDGGPSESTRSPTHAPAIATQPESPSTSTPPVESSPNGGEPHGQPDHDGPSGNADNGSSGIQSPYSDDPPNPPDGPNNPPHTGLYDPPANHAPPGATLPDLTDINNEYRLPNGAVDPARFDEWTEKVAEAYPTITKDGVQGVYNYTTANYEGMNPYLRNVEDLTIQQSGILDAPSIGDMTDAQRASWEAQIKQTDEGLAALPPYRADPADMMSTTWRGIDAPDSLLDQMKVGDTFSDPGYLSTSKDPHVADSFTPANPDTTPTVLTVVGRDGVDVSQLSRYMDESEILFPRGTQFEIVVRELGPDGVLRITMRQIDP